MKAWPYLPNRSARIRRLIPPRPFPTRARAIAFLFRPVQPAHRGRFVFTASPPQDRSAKGRLRRGGLRTQQKWQTPARHHYTCKLNLASALREGRRMRADFTFHGNRHRAASLTRVARLFWVIPVLLGGFVQAEELPLDKINPKGHSRRCHRRGIHA